MDFSKFRERVRSLEELKGFVLSRLQEAGISPVVQSTTMVGKEEAVLVQWRLGSPDSMRQINLVLYRTEDVLGFSCVGGAARVKDMDFSQPVGLASLMSILHAGGRCNAAA